MNIFYFNVTASDSDLSNKVTKAANTIPKEKCRPINQISDLSINGL